MANNILDIPETPEEWKQKAQEAAGDPIAAIIKDVFAEDQKAHPAPPELKARIMQSVQDMSTAQKFSTNIHDHNLMQAQVSDSKAATEFMRVADSTHHDAIAVCPPGCVIMQGDSRAMQETMAKFGVQRQDVALDNNQAVATYWPAQTQSASGLAESMVCFYQQRAAIEHCQQMGVDSIDVRNNMVFAMGGITQAKVPQIMDTLSAEFKNTCVVYRNEGKVEIALQADSRAMAKLDSMGYGAISASGPDQPPVFRFDSLQEAQQFVNDANRAVSELKPQVGIDAKSGITIIKAHSLPLQEATAAVTDSKIGGAYSNSVVLKSMDATGDHMRIMVDGRSPLGQALMERHADKMTGSSSPDVAVFTMNSKQEAVAFLQDANELGNELGRDAADIGDIPLD